LNFKEGFIQNRRKIAKTNTITLLKWG